MAPITCKVVDAANRGQAGAHVVLECKDHLYRGIATLEGLTDKKGGIGLWLPTTSPGRIDKLEPQTVDSIDIPRVSLTFYPHMMSSRCGAPFMSIRTDLYLKGGDWHGITFRLGPEPRLTHSSFPVADPFDMSAAATAGPPTSHLNQSAPSPLLLPSPVFPTGYTPRVLDDGVGGKNGKRGQKRKSEHDEHAPKKRRR